VRAQNEIMRVVKLKIRIVVRDRGPGIPRDKQSQLFSKFSQLDQPEEIKKMGSGLRLYICKTLIAAQNGATGVDSELGVGTCFWCELPETAMSIVQDDVIHKS
jgi:signal transduction histidine kinase